ncbi:phosphoribosylanthranilate isomerase [Methyloferula stellata]|uniref:phosphoribosylanthranilate isomerase n=1 Tax=Methyloferula stellata TaxID=876270 RepID=UPI00036FEDA2|nr:phosphoribosylanthranilate isomerase [Methyloferula stellata]
MSLTIKICGLSTPETLDAALAAGADMVGFVFFEKSPRRISLEAARLLGGRTGTKALKVALTVDADDATLAAIIAELKPQLLQLHGQETPERVAGIRARFGLPVMKAVGLAQKDDLAAIGPYATVADWLLLDAKPAPDAALPGGNGEAFDWSLLHDLQLGKPWLLAGGLRPDNVASAVGISGAPGVDVSSGVESLPGVKDIAKIGSFIANARQVTEGLGSLRQSG